MYKESVSGVDGSEGKSCRRHPDSKLLQSLQHAFKVAGDFGEATNDFGF